MPNVLEKLLSTKTSSVMESTVIGGASYTSSPKISSTIATPPRPTTTAPIAPSSSGGRVVHPARPGERGRRLDHGGRCPEVRLTGHEAHDPVAFTLALPGLLHHLDHAERGDGAGAR